MSNKVPKFSFFFLHCSDPFTKLAKNVKMRLFSLCTGHAFQLQFLGFSYFLSSLFFASLESTKKKKKGKTRSAALERLDSSDSPPV